MIWLYRLLIIPALILSGPYYVYRMLRRGGYSRVFHHKLGGITTRTKQAGVKRIWIQAVSMGESQALRPILEAWRDDPSVEVVMTTTNSAALTFIEDAYKDLIVAAGMFPIDFVLFSRRAWKTVQPDLVILMETEVWPEHIQQAVNRKVPVALINGRLSDRSFQHYQSFKPAAAWLFNRLSLILAATAQDQTRFAGLVSDPSRIHETGNIKLDAAVDAPLHPNELDAIRKELGFTSPQAGKTPAVILGSSTWPGEEDILIEALQEARASRKDVRLLIVPRHAERGKEIAQRLEKQAYPWHQRSISRQAEEGCCIYLADTVGELKRLTQVANLVFIGKSLPPHTEGQTPIEAAAFGRTIITGPGMSNFRSIVDSLVANDACLQLDSPEEVQSAIIELLNQPDRRQQLATNAQAWHQANLGATRRTLERLKRLLP